MFTIRWPYLVLFLGLLFATSAGVIYLHKDRVLLFKKPPASLAQWYKPENKRQVWLHNMFKLRREMQAVRLYADRQDAPHLDKWLARLVEHYLKIGEMVPEWKEDLDLASIAVLQKSADTRRYQDVAMALDSLRENCNSCHKSYRVITATLYRAPDFSRLKLDGSISYESHMEELGKQVNSIKIASEDGEAGLALSSLEELRKGIDLLGSGCDSCHKKNTPDYPGKAISVTLDNLEESLRSGSPREQGKQLGTLAVQACAHCHGTHRLSYDNRKIYSQQPDWSELIKH